MQKETHSGAVRDAPRELFHQIFPAASSTSPGRREEEEGKEDNAVASRRHNGARCIIMDG